MYANIFKVLTALYLAVVVPNKFQFLRDALPFDAISKVLAPENIAWEAILATTMWTILFLLFLQVLLHLIGFATTGGVSRFGTSRPYRLVQGVTAEVFMVSLLCFAGTLALTASPYSSFTAEYQRALDKNGARQDAYQASLKKYKDGINARNSEISDAFKQLKRISSEIEQAKKLYLAPKFASIKREIANLAPDGTMRRATKERLETVIDLRKFHSSIAKCVNDDAPTQGTEDCQNLEEFYLGDNSRLTISAERSELLNLVKKYNGLVVEEQEIEASKEIALEGNRTAIRPTIPMLLTVPDSQDFWNRFLPTFRKNHWIIFAAIGLWIANRLAFKEGFSAYYTRMLRLIDEGRMGFGGSARFAGMFEEWGKVYRPGSLYMGRSLFNPFQEIGLKDDAHMLTIAASRAGKGATAIIPNLLLWQGSTVVIDPKGTNARVTADARRRMGQDVHIIDPFNIVTDDSARFDPFAGLKSDDPIIRERITSIADALVIPDEHSKDEHWNDGAKTIISGLISYVLSRQTAQGPWLHDVRDLVNQLPEEQDRMWAEMFATTGAGGFARDAAARYIRGSESSEILSIMSNADKHTEWLSSPAMRNVLSKPTFSLTDLKIKPTTVYLVIPPRHLKRQRRLLRLFINLMIDAMEAGGRSDIPVLMIMDEFLALGKMTEIEDAFATMASYNLIMWPFVQELGKLKAMYGGSFNAFLANSRAVQIFGASDPVTTKYISERLGTRPLGSLKNIARSNENVALRTPDDIEKDVNKEFRRQYILEAGKPPMLIEKVPYYDSRPVSFLPFGGRFAGRYEPDPDFKRKKS